MGDFQSSVEEYRRQLERGVIVTAYRGLMQYVMALRTHFAERYPQYAVSGSIYYGYMDMTYFAFAPDLLKERRLKIAIVLIHRTCRFEAWLSAANKQVQSDYWRRIRDAGWNKYRLVQDTRAADSIIECDLVKSPDFDDLEALTAQIEQQVLCFSRDVEAFLSGG